jgi:diguanylate cyclase (GGDEF)-like protein
MATRKIPDESLPWEKTCQVELMGGNRRKVGMILFPEIETGVERELIRLFSESFGAFLHNRLLLRQLEEKASTDPLTGLFNRGYFEKALEAEKKKSETFGIHYSIIFIDANRLKQANDLYGHEAGDRLLLAISDRLRAETRETDIVARTGGDEFFILLSDTPEEGAKRLAKRFAIEVFDSVALEVGDGETFPVSVSAGAAGSDQVAHDDILMIADKRMYEAKTAYYRNHDKYR